MLCSTSFFTVVWFDKFSLLKYFRTNRSAGVNIKYLCYISIGTEDLQCKLCTCENYLIQNFLRLQSIVSNHLFP